MQGGVRMAFRSPSVIANPHYQRSKVPDMKRLRRHSASDYTFLGFVSTELTVPSVDERWRGVIVAFASCKSKAREIAGMLENACSGRF